MTDVINEFNIRCNNVSNLNIIKELIPNIEVHLNNDDYDNLFHCLRILRRSASNLFEGIEELKNKE